MKASLATVIVALLTLTACGGDDGGDDGPDTDEAPAEELSSYETVADLNEALDAGGIDCALDYEGLVDDVRELSQCTIDGGQAILTIWFDDALLQDFIEPEGDDPPEAVAYGEDWTVEAADPATASAVADAAGGATTDV